MTFNLRAGKSDAGDRVVWPEAAGGSHNMPPTQSAGRKGKRT
ncbi:hypothetical protein [Microcoleus sp. S13_C5]